VKAACTLPFSSSNNRLISMRTRLIQALLVNLFICSLSFASGATWEPGKTRCIPNFSQDKFVGYRCVRVEPGSLYSKMGLAPTDNIVEINGKPLTALTDATMDLWNEFDASAVSLTVEREGRRMTLLASKAK
jgi:C-terminal processing protease CtpA/Prc